MSVRLRLRVVMAGAPTRRRPATGVLSAAGCDSSTMGSATRPDEKPASYRPCDKVGAATAKRASITG